MGCSADAERIPLIVDVGGPSMSKLPFVIAAAQGLYEKHEMRRYVAEEFYDDSLMREIDGSGFLDGFTAIDSIRIRGARPPLGEPLGRIAPPVVPHRAQEVA